MFPPAIFVIVIFGIYLAAPLAVKAGERYHGKKPLQRPRLLQRIDEKSEKLSTWTE
jgi:hypothetical protein